MRHIKVILFSFVLWIILTASAQAQGEICICNTGTFDGGGPDFSGRSWVYTTNVVKGLAPSNLVGIYSGDPVIDTAVIIPIPPTTTVAALSAFKKGTYSFTTAQGLIYFSVDTGTVVKIVNTVCPPPIVCPICPTVPKQRTATGMQWSAILQRFIITYDDLSQSNL